MLKNIRIRKFEFMTKTQKIVYSITDILYTIFYYIIPTDVSQISFI